MPTQIPAIGRCAVARSRRASSSPWRPAGRCALDVADPGDQRQRRLAHVRCVGGHDGVDAGTGERRGERAEIPGP